MLGLVKNIGHLYQGCIQWWSYCTTIQNLLNWGIFLKISQVYPNRLYFVLFTYPISYWPETPLVKEYVEYHDDGKGWVVGDDGLSAAKLALMDNIQPSAEDQDPGNAVKRCLQKQEHSTTCCQGTLLCPIP